MPQNQENNIQNSIDSTHTNDKPIKTLSPKTSKSVISKEQEALQLSDGNIVDFPEIINDATDTTVRSIRYVYNDKGEIVNADLFFQKSSAEEISHVSRMLSEADIKMVNIGLVVYVDCELKLLTEDTETTKNLCFSFMRKRT